MSLHRRDEVACVLIEKIESPVMAGDGSLEGEETPDRERRRLSAHGETIADRYHANLWRINLRDEPHVRKNIGVAHVVETRAILGANDNAVRTAKIDGLAIDDR